MKFSPGDIVNVVTFDGQVGAQEYSVLCINTFETYTRQEPYRNKQGKMTRNIYLTLKAEDGSGLSYADQRNLRLVPHARPLVGMPIRS